MANEWDIDGVVEPEGGVEYDIGWVVERDTEGGETYTLSLEAGTYTLTGSAVTLTYLSRPWFRMPKKLLLLGVGMG